MARLIDADKFKQEISAMAIKNNYPVRKANALCEIIDRQPTVDAEPVRRMKWIREPDCGITRCSICGWSIEECIDWDYCPNCGAKMEESDNG